MAVLVAALVVVSGVPIPTLALEGATTGAVDSPAFDADQHVVAVNLSDVGVTAGTVRVLVRQFDTTGGGFVAVDDLPDVGVLTVVVGDGPADPPSVDPPSGAWFLLATDEDDPEVPVDLARLSGQDDATALYLQVGFHGDYAAPTTRTTTVYLDVDDDPATGLPFVGLSDPTFGADYALAVRPSGTALQSYDQVARAFVPAGAAAYHAPDFEADEHVVGVSFAQLGIASRRW